MSVNNPAIIEKYAIFGTAVYSGQAVTLGWFGMPVSGPCRPLSFLQLVENIRFN